MFTRLNCLLMVLIVIVACAGVGCNTPVEYASKRLPAGATNITDLGNQWVGFEFEGHKYTCRQLESQAAVVVRRD